MGCAARAATKAVCFCALCSRFGRVPETRSRLWRATHPRVRRDAAQREMPSSMTYLHVTPDGSLDDGTVYVQNFTVPAVSVPVQPTPDLAPAPPPAPAVTVGQLQEMFPGIDNEVIRSVLTAQNGNAQAAINTLLEMAQDAQPPDPDHHLTESAS